MRTKRNTNIKVWSNLRSNEKQGFSNKKNNVSDSSFTNRDRSKSEGLLEVYLHEKNTMIWIKLEREVIKKLEHFFPKHQKCNQEIKKTIS